MLIPLPKDMDDALHELAACNGEIDIDQYSVEEKAVMLKLVEIGLISIRFVLNTKGKERLEKEKAS